MGTKTPGVDVRPNRRGVKSREAVLDAAERVMAEHSYDGASVARVVEESGIPMSSVYHYFGSKEGILLAVMQRGADRFFADLPQPTERLGSASEHLAGVSAVLAAALDRHPDFLSLLIVFATQPTAMRNDEIRTVVTGVRDHARGRLRSQLALAFGEPAESSTIDRLARLALALIDGAFVASQAEPDQPVSGLIAGFSDALVAMHRSLPAT